MKSIKFSDYFEMQKPTYVYIKIIPDTSIRNYNSTNIVKAIHYMQKSIGQRIKKEKGKYKWIPKITVESPSKASYFIDIYKESVNFYFIIPRLYVGIAKEKIIETWPRATIEEVEAPKNFSNECLTYELVYKKEDALSLNIDRKNNEPLNSLLTVIDILKDKDRVGIFYNFIPQNNYAQLGFKTEYKKTMNKIKDHVPIDRNKFDKKYIAKMTVNTVVTILEGILEAVSGIFGIENKDKDVSFLELALGALNNIQDLSSSTKRKKETTVINTQIAVISDSKDIVRKENNALAVCQAFKVLDEDNELIYKKATTKFEFEDYKLQKLEENKTSIDECSNFIQLPGRELLTRFKNIKKTDVLENEIPKELQQGTKLVGISEFKGNAQNAYFTTDKDYKNLAVVYIGPTRSGKTTALCNYAKDSINAGESIIVPDYIENCGLSEDIKKYIPKEKVLEIDLSNFNNLEGLGYNELDNMDTNDPLEIYDNAKLKTNQLGYLVNSINADDSELKARMERYLDAAAIVVFINNGPIKDVFQVLQDYKLRKEYIDRVPSGQREYTEEYISALEELDEWSKATKDKPSKVIGTKLSFVQGILNRVNKLKKNTVLELMLKKDTKDNINLTEEIQEGKAIFIKMPENKFGTPEERDIITTYWLTKIWLALQIRAYRIPNRYDRTTVSIITDELNQLSSAQEFVGIKLDQCAKFGGKFVISTMYINQLKIREKLRTANTSYIIISGSDKVNYTELKEELNGFGFTLEDLMNLKRFHSLNYIKYEKGYSAFISKLPPPIN